MVQARHAHPQLPRQALHPQRLVKLPAEPLDRCRDAVGVAAQERQVTEPVSLLSHQQQVMGGIIAIASAVTALPFLSLANER